MNSIISSSPAVCSMMRIATFGAVACALPSSPAPPTTPAARPAALATTPVPRGIGFDGVEPDSTVGPGPGLESNEILDASARTALPRTPNYDPDVALTTVSRQVYMVVYCRYTCGCSCSLGKPPPCLRGAMRAAGMGGN